MEKEAWEVVGLYRRERLMRRVPPYLPRSILAIALVLAVRIVDMALQRTIIGSVNISQVDFISSYLSNSNECSN